jgi:ribonuclease BN (tRNA processing enzyme)
MQKTSNQPTMPERRRLLGRWLTAGASAALLGALPATRIAAQNSSAPAPPPGPPPLPAGTRLVLLGTRGGPGVDLARSQTASVVVVDGAPYLFDCGYGTMRALVASGVGFQRVGAIFFSHLHNDHTSDLAALLSHQWTGSKTTPTQVYGPHGTQALVEAAIAFFRADVEIRTVDEGRTVRPETLFHGRDLAATEAPTHVLKDERVNVTAAENTHYSDAAKSRMPHRALSYRIDTNERSIVFSGDTAYSKNLVALARGADFFVCEVMAQSVYEQNMARAKADAAAGNANSISRHVAETHSTPTDVGRMAAEAGVKTVVLYHQLPSARTGGLDAPVTDFIDGVRSEFEGEVIVGHDLMVL